MDEVDAIVGACAVGLQPIPCTAALVLSEIAKERKIPAFDINSTCTSFITALDMLSYQIAAGRYRNVLLLSGDTASIALNPDEKHSFELLGDGAVSAIVSPSSLGAVLYSTQLTSATGVRKTELVGGGTMLPAYGFCEENRASYQFHMEGRAALVETAQLIEELFAKIDAECSIKLSDIDMVIPHQASSALRLIMRRLGVDPSRYIDLTRAYGNMVSASVPFALDYAVHNGRVKRGDIVMLLGTAAGLTINALIMKY